MKPNSMLFLTKVTAFLCLFCSMPALVQGADLDSVEVSFRRFMALALKNPSSYGFADREEASNCKLGRCYGFYSTTEWTEAHSKMSLQELSDPELAPEKVYEVNAPNGNTRCAFVLARQAESNAFRPVLLGRQDIAQRLQLMSALPSRDRLVLILDVSQKKLLYADASNPASTLSFR
jgi:hypothetical protein